MTLDPQGGRPLLLSQNSSHPLRSLIPGFEPLPRIICHFASVKRFGHWVGEIGERVFNLLTKPTAGMIV